MAIKHVVLFKLHARTPATLAKAMGAIESLREGIDEVQALEVGVDFAVTTLSYDVAATVTFRDRAALDSYSSHPRHREVLAVMRELSSAVAIVDFHTSPAAGPAE